ncbi:MAG: SDR family NAD(P)-dependent oxidoreductase [Spirochaetes bacterium]|nr:SDR family NAD(P)-dependent oxidoreductase [Spirochaetota bacterium]
MRCGTRSRNGRGRHEGAGNGGTGYGSIQRNREGRYGRIDVLVNNAATIIVTPAEEADPEDLLRSFRANLVGPVAAANRAAVQMRRQGYGHIINVGSPGFMIGIPYYLPYVCSKAAMTAWTRTIQAEWHGSGVVVSEYFPGYIKTDSPAESSRGPVAQDLIVDPEANPVSRFFTRPKSPEAVARQLVRLVERPRTLAASGFMVKMGAFLSNIPGVRLSIARNMARAVRKRLDFPP